MRELHGALEAWLSNQSAMALSHDDIKILKNQSLASDGRRNVPWERWAMGVTKKSSGPRTERCLQR